MKKTSILVNSAEKKVNMKVAGAMTMDDANLFVEEYKAKVEPIGGQQYALIVDCTEMNLLTQEMTENLAGVMQMYKATEFSTITYNIKENHILKMQLNRIARSAGLTNYEVTEL